MLPASSIRTAAALSELQPATTPTATAVAARADLRADDLCTGGFNQRHPDLPGNDRSTGPAPKRRGMLQERRPR